ncbi:MULTISPECIES: hypothetical protein [unclassified Moraxella]|uniref:hypothetical protein n=1 Tax=unclassified Moraxella TaxID=2685852 RepID=UPI003AF71AC1
MSLTEAIATIAKDNKPTLMLLDEVQELARVRGTEGLIRALRTGLDVHKDKIKVIFTGSSTNGLRLIFNDSKAPFFHFSHAIDFPKLDKGFSDFLADIYAKRTGQEIDKDGFFELFQRLNYTPLYLRAIAQDMIINPNLTLEQASVSRLEQLHEQSDFNTQWLGLTELEKHLILMIGQGESGLYKKHIRQILAQKLGLEGEISTSNIQTNLKKLERKELITKQINDCYVINNSLFAQWLVENDTLY